MCLKNISVKNRAFIYRISKEADYMKMQVRQINILFLSQIKDRFIRTSKLFFYSIECLRCISYHQFLNYKRKNEEKFKV